MLDSRRACQLADAASKEVAKQRLDVKLAKLSVPTARSAADDATVE